jgi:hypothetical protein
MNNIEQSKYIVRYGKCSPMVHCNDCFLQKECMTTSLANDSILWDNLIEHSKIILNKHRQNKLKRISKWK